MDQRARALERQAELGDADAAARLAALQRRVEPARDCGLVITLHQLERTRLRKTVQLVMELTGRTQEEAEDLCRAALAPVLRRATRDEAEAARARFEALGVQARVTEKRAR